MVAMILSRRMLLRRFLASFSTPALPVITFSGKTFASRVAASLLHACGLPQLVCTSSEAYTDTIRSLIIDPVKRSALREHLVKARNSSPLFDSARFTRDYEALLSSMVTTRRDD